VQLGRMSRALLHTHTNVRIDKASFVASSEPSRLDDLDVKVRDNPRLGHLFDFDHRLSLFSSPVNYERILIII